MKLACPHLIFSGLMTIGMKDYSSTPENFKVGAYPVLLRRKQQRAFCVGFHNLLFWVLWIQALVNCKLEVCKALDIPTEQFELSMGMSGDFEQAVCNIIILILCVGMLKQDRTILEFHQLMLTLCRLRWAARMWGLDQPFLDQGSIQTKGRTSEIQRISVISIPSPLD